MPALSTKRDLSSAIRDGVTGILVRAGDPRALRDCVTRLAVNASLRESLGRAARRAVERDFDANRCVERLVSVLERAYA